METHNNVTALVNRARLQLADNMTDRNIGAILWDNSQAGFHYIPEITLSEGSNPIVSRVMGLYVYDNKLYAIEEDVADVGLNDFYTEGIEVPPTVVTLTPDKASEILGDPATEKGYTTAGSPEEWLTIADCYFEALAED